MKIQTIQASENKQKTRKVTEKFTAEDSSRTFESKEGKERF